MTRELPRYAAANARVRTLLATLLGRRGLESLATYPSAQTVLEALQRTPYAPLLAARAPPDANLRGQLPSVGRAVLALLTGSERSFVHQFLLGYEVDNLKVLIRAVDQAWPWQRIAPHITSLGDIATVDPEALSGARDLPDLSARLAGTAYGPALRAALHRLDTDGPFALEVGIELDYYDRLWSALDTLSHADAPRAQRLLGILFDVLNLNWIAHYRDVLGLSPEEILNYTLRQGRWITPAVRRSLAGGAQHSWDGPLARTPYAAMLADVSAHGFDAAAPALWRFLAAEAERMLGGYPFHIGVPLAFLLAQELEIRDLQVLLAAKSIHTPTAEIADCLVSAR
jgi:V/A-type H+-transporting ATPase subunit C